MATSRHPIRSTWLTGPLLVLALLGHDALMASSARAVPLPGAAMPAHNPSATQHASDDHEAPEHPDACHATAEAAPYSANPLDALDVGAAARLIDADPSAATLHVVVAWTEPQWPPGTIRALLQVYRI